jgi:hypothetical protein
VCVLLGLSSLFFTVLLRASLPLGGGVLGCFGKSRKKNNSETSDVISHQRNPFYKTETKTRQTMLALKEHVGTLDLPMQNLCRGKGKERAKKVRSCLTKTPESEKSPGRFSHPKELYTIH